MLTYDHINRYLRHLAEDLHRAPTTVNGYAEELRLLVERSIPLEPEALARHLSMQPDGRPLAASTRNRRLAILRGFLRYLREHELLHIDPLSQVRRARVPKRTRSALTAADLEAVVRALLASPSSWRRTRDGAILLMFFYTGLRLSELVRLNVNQVDLGAGVLRAALRKGGDLTDVVIHPCLATQLLLWLRARPESEEPALFPRGNTGGRLTGRRIEARIHELGEFASLGVRLHPHLLRHAHATGLLREGVATAVIQQSMNHHALATTETYLHGDQALLRGAIERLPALPLVPPDDPAQGARPADPARRPGIAGTTKRRPAS